MCGELVTVFRLYIYKYKHSYNFILVLYLSIKLSIYLGIFRITMLCVKYIWGLIKIL